MFFFIRRNHRLVQKKDVLHPMKTKWIIFYFFVLLLPYLALMIAGHAGGFQKKPESQAEEMKEEKEIVCLYRTQSNEFEELKLRDYLWGVLAGEMPASYPEEALKAQVVASYSYLLHREKTIAEHPGQDFGHDGDICDNPAHCKAFLSPKEAAARYGKDWLDTNQESLYQAVDAVIGEALLYKKEPVNAVFHAMSGGYTEDAEDVWGAAVPYLQSVDSHWDAKSKDFSTIVTIPLSDFKKILNQTDCTLGAVTLTKGGSVATQVIGEKRFTGRELRSLFNLRSTRFTLNITNQEAIFSVSGYGHQVGMSQYGAGILAEEGYTYQEILFYYYTGTALVQDYYPEF